MVALRSRAKTRAGRDVEQVRAGEIGHEPDAVAGAAIHALANERGHLLAVEAAEELRVGAGRLDDDDLGRETVGTRDRSVLGPHAVEDRLAVGRPRA